MDRYQGGNAPRARSRSRIERLRRDAAAYALVERVAKLRRTSMRELLQGTRGVGNAALTRQIAMYLIHVLLSRPQEVVGVLFGRERTTVTHACATIEALRDDDPALDAELTGIEGEGWSALVELETRHVA